jgi:hypothetical protein
MSWVERRLRMKMTVLWVVGRKSGRKFTDVSEVLAASIITAMSLLLC